MSNLETSVKTQGRKDGSQGFRWHGPGSWCSTENGETLTHSLLWSQRNKGVNYMVCNRK